MTILDCNVLKTIVHIDEADILTANDLGPMSFLKKGWNMTELPILHLSVLKNKVTNLKHGLLVQLPGEIFLWYMRGAIADKWDHLFEINFRNNF